MEMQDTTRRTFLRAGAAAAGAGALAGGVPTAGAAEPFGGWLSNTSNFDGVVDKTGQDSVTITVGVTANSGSNGFGPAAVRVDPGTKVVWEWSGNGYHNVKEKGGAFESETVGEKGHSFSQTFEENGVVKYACVPHKMMGMKGVVVVGDVEIASGDSDGEKNGSGPDYGDWFKNTDNFESTVDKTGQDSVTVTVGARGNNGALAFDPPAIEVDPGTEVVWEWADTGSAHNVVAEDGSYKSELTAEGGYTFSQTFESAGIHKYACVPHKQMGMKGAVVVSDTGGGSGVELTDVLAIGAGFSVVAGLFGLFGVGLKEHGPNKE